MTRNHLLLCLIVIAACFVGTEAIVGGTIAANGQFPYQVSLQHNGRHFCGGGIIRDKFVLSAAYCFVRPDGRFQDIQVTVVAGTTRFDPLDVTAVKIPVKRIYIPSEFTPTLRSASNIAVLELNRTVIFSRMMKVLKVKIPKIKTEDEDIRVAEIAGFGYHSIDYNGVTESNGQFDSRLRFAVVDILLLDDPHYLATINYEKQICARMQQRPHVKRGVCTGDGGSLLVYNQTAIGILSSNPRGCTERDFGATYTRITYHTLFLRKVLSIRPTDNRIRVHDLIR